MGSCLVLKIIGVSTYNGMSRNGTPYVLTTLELDHDGSKAKIKCFEKDVRVGDFAQISIGTKKTVFGAEFCVIVEKIIPSVEIENNWK